jgi:hypothetical protein
MPDIADIIPSNAQASDRLLVRRGANTPFGLDALANITPEQLVDLLAEVVAARGSRSNLNNRITTISNFASPNAGGIIVGQYYDNAFHAAGRTTLAGAANRVDMAPFYTSAPLRIDQLGVAISGAVSGSSLRCFIYGSDADGWPDDLLYEGPSDMSGSASGYVNHTLDFAFESGRQYWMGVRWSANTTVRAIPLTSAANLGSNGAAATQYFTTIRRTITFADPLPATWNFVAGDRAANVAPPAITFRAAAL